MSQLTHELREDFHKKEVPTPNGYPTLTFNVNNLTQEHIDAFEDEEEQLHYFKKVKQTPVEITFPTAEEMKAEIEKLQKKFDEGSAAYKTGRHGKNLEEKIMGLMLQLEAIEKESEKDTSEDQQ